MGIANDMATEAQPLLFFIMGLPSVGFGLVTLPDAIQFVRAAQPADGVVIEVRKHHRVTIEYQTPDGQLRDANERIEGAQVGDRLTVYFQPDEPWGERAVGSPYEALREPGFSLLFGLGLVGGGVFMVRRNRAS